MTKERRAAIATAKALANADFGPCYFVNWSTELFYRLSNCVPMIDFRHSVKNFRNKLNIPKCSRKKFRRRSI